MQSPKQKKTHTNTQEMNSYHQIEKLVKEKFYVVWLNCHRLFLNEVQWCLCVVIVCSSMVIRWLKARIRKCNAKLTVKGRECHTQSILLFHQYSNDAFCTLYTMLHFLLWIMTMSSILLIANCIQITFFSLFTSNTRIR